MQTQTAATAVNVAFGLPFVVVGVIMTAIVAFVIMGGIKRIGQVAEFLAPVMCGIYFLITIIIIVLNIGKVPGMFGSIFASAFGKDAVFGGIVGSAVSWGIKRGFFSNDAGNGMSPLISATTDTSHPVKSRFGSGIICVYRYSFGMYLYRNFYFACGNLQRCSRRSRCFSVSRACSGNTVWNCIYAGGNVGINR